MGPEAPGPGPAFRREQVAPAAPIPALPGDVTGVNGPVDVEMWSVTKTCNARSARPAAGGVNRRRTKAGYDRDGPEGGGEMAGATGTKRREKVVGNMSHVKRTSRARGVSPGDGSWEWRWYPAPCGSPRSGVR